MLAETTGEKATSRSSRCEGAQASSRERSERSDARQHEQFFHTASAAFGRDDRRTDNRRAPHGEFSMHDEQVGSCSLDEREGDLVLCLAEIPKGGAQSSHGPPSQGGRQVAQEHATLKSSSMKSLKQFSKFLVYRDEAAAATEESFVFCVGAGHSRQYLHRQS